MLILENKLPKGQPFTKILLAKENISPRQPDNRYFRPLSDVI